MANRVITSKMLESGELRHYGVKGMEWGKVKKEDPNKYLPMPNSLVKDAPKPFTLSKDLPKTQPRPYQFSKAENRTTSEIQDDVKNRIKDFKDVPRFDPKTEDITTAIKKINEGYAYSGAISEDLAKTYNLYDSDGYIKSFNNNCPSASFAYELRRRGMDVEAGLTGGMYVDEIAKAFNISSEEFAQIQKTDAIPPKTMAELQETMKAMGPGARGACIMHWERGGGHICSFEINSKGEVVFIDAQSGQVSGDKTKDGPADYYKNADAYFIVRTDNRKMNNEVLKDWVRIDDRIDPKDVDRIKNVDAMNTSKKKTEQAKINYNVDRKNYLADADKKKKKAAVKVVAKDNDKSLKDVVSKKVKKGKKMFDKFFKKD